MKKTLLGVIVLAAAGAAAQGGEHIRFTFHGTFDTASGPVPGPAAVGDPFTVMYVFDAATPDTDPSPIVGEYTGAIIGDTVTAGTYVFSTTPGLISVLNDAFAGDAYLARIQNPIIRADVVLQDFTGAVFQDDSLPLDLNLAAFGLARFTFHGDVGPTFWEVSGAITSFEREVLPECYPNCNGDVDPMTGAPILDTTDFGCFTNRFINAHPYADCNADGVLDTQDFGCFTNAFILGCP
jgi:hypothetical protein